MNTFFLVLELIGTTAFSASGAMTGLRRRMDVFGVCILGLTTAVGGGVIRDLILGNTPPATFRDPVYAAVAVLTALVCFLPRVRRFFAGAPGVFDRLLFWMDTVGLGIFTVTGIRTAYACFPRPSLFLLVFVGVVTGAGGGVVRDVLAGDTPYIFVKHIYACASLAGAVVCGLLWHRAGEAPSMVLGVAVVILLRALADHYRWNLPRPRE